MFKITTKNLIFFAYFLAIFIFHSLGHFSFSFNFLKNTFWELILWFLGVVVGTYFVKIDQLIYIYFTLPEAHLSLQTRWLIKQKRYRDSLRLLDQRSGEQRLAFHSALFQVVWVVLAFFTLTSTSVIFGKTLVMAIGLTLLVQEWEDVLAKKGINWLFWQIKRIISPQEQKMFLWIMTGLFGILSLLLI